MSDDLLSDITMLKANVVRLIKEREALGDYDVNASFHRQMLGMFLLLTGLVENVVRVDLREHSGAKAAEVVQSETGMAGTGTQGQATSGQAQTPRRRSPIKH